MEFNIVLATKLKKLQPFSTKMPKQIAGKNNSLFNNIIHSNRPQSSHERDPVILFEPQFGVLIDQIIICQHFDSRNF